MSRWKDMSWIPSLFSLSHSSSAALSLQEMVIFARKNWGESEDRILPLADKVCFDLLPIMKRDLGTETVPPQGPEICLLPRAYAAERAHLYKPLPVVGVRALQDSVWGGNGYAATGGSSSALSITQQSWRQVQGSLHSFHGDRRAARRSC
ncbi:hypothetical protein MLD38_015703 [Melastoma candidum]|uniref:Uncharacterized protein n=1 Tax=Melastoma candidum TaxID=119954 RepID=A0ACB9RKN5_9MYRT|nr:hypothetical protein MLD38_015703 [Melastoma candidum]